MLSRIPPSQVTEGLIPWFCYCSMGYSHFQCKHSLAYALVNKDMQVPLNRNLSIIGKTPQVGRPAKAKPALERQPDSLETTQRRCQNLADKGFTSQDDDPACWLCGNKKNTKKNPIIFCDNCDLAYHQHCIRLREIPPGAWYCNQCNNVQ